MVKIGVGIISYLALLGFIALVVLAILYISRFLFKAPLAKRIERILAPYTYQLAFFLALIATSASLFLSEVLHFAPCVLCWYQRIVMYPQTLLLYTALMRNERVLKPYLLVLNIVGMIVSLYHYSLHILPRTILPILPCAKNFGGVPCDKGYDLYFGFMSFALMSWVVFALITYLLLIAPSKKKQSR